MKIFYLHGYQGSLTPEKRDLLESLGELEAPHVDYDQPDNLFSSLYERVKAGGFNVCVGTSLGGIMALFIANHLKLPCLVFNPAVTYIDQLRKFVPAPYFTLENNRIIDVVSGVKDEIIPYKEQLKFVEQLKTLNTSVNHYIEDHVEHGIDYKIFEKYVEGFILKKPV